MTIPERGDELRDPSIRRPPNSGRQGMGDFLEYDYRYPQLKGQMPAPNNEVVYSPVGKEAQLPPGMEWLRAFAEEMKSQFAAMMAYVLQATPQKAMPPPWQAQPFFSVPNLNYNKLTVVAGGPGAAWNDIITFPAYQRHRLVFGGMGTSAECFAAMADLQWRIRAGDTTYPFIIDDTITTQLAGTWSVPIGTIQDPMSFMGLANQPKFNAIQSVILQVRNISPTFDHTPEAIIASFLYTVTHDDQEEAGDFSAVCGGVSGQAPGGPGSGM